MRVSPAPLPKATVHAVGLPDIGVNKVALLDVLLLGGACDAEDMICFTLSRPHKAHVISL